ncbi:MAG: arginase family protein, partial [Paracoccus sp. (in: a-proteobacteria)]|nr:arginase family protein [Paracoccus sp. (in: a-proteobacteria)]
MTHCILIGAPMDEGQRRAGCLMGPAAYRVAGLAQTLTTLGHTVEDRGDVAPGPAGDETTANPAVDRLPQVVAWTRALRAAAESAMADGMPLFMGGDHALSLGTVAGVAAYAARAGRPLFVIWLDAHSDFHTVESTTSGNLHGTPMAYASGRAGFAGFPPFPAPVPGENICMFGIRSVDPAE